MLLTGQPFELCIGHQDMGGLAPVGNDNRAIPGSLLCTAYILVQIAARDSRNGHNAPLVGMYLHIACSARIATER